MIYGSRGEEEDQQVECTAACEPPSCRRWRPCTRAEYIHFVLTEMHFTTQFIAIPFTAHIQFTIQNELPLCQRWKACKACNRWEACNQPLFQKGDSQCCSYKFNLLHPFNSVRKTSNLIASAGGRILGLPFRIGTNTILLRRSYKFNLLHTFNLLQHGSHLVAGAGGHILGLPFLIDRSVCKKRIFVHFLARNQRLVL